MLESLFWLFLGYEIGTQGRITREYLAPFLRSVISNGGK